MTPPANSKARRNAPLDLATPTHVGFDVSTRAARNEAETGLRHPLPQLSRASSVSPQLSRSEGREFDDIIVHQHVGRFGARFAEKERQSLQAVSMSQHL